MGAVKKKDQPDILSRATREERERLTDFKKVAAVLRRWALHHRKEDRAAAIMAILPRVKINAKIYAAQRGLRDDYLDNILSFANEAAVHIVDRWQYTNTLGQLPTMVRRGIVDCFRLEFGRPHLGRSKVRAAEVQLIRRADHADRVGSGIGMTIELTPDPKAPPPDIRLDGIEEATRGLMRIESAKHRAVLTLVAAGWAHIDIGKAFGVTDSRISQLITDAQAMARMAARLADHSAGNESDDVEERRGRKRIARSLRNSLSTRARRRKDRKD